MKIHEFINEANWTQGYYARDINDENVHSKDPRACKWCLNGMVFFIYRNRFRNDDERRGLRLNIFQQIKDKLDSTCFCGSGAKWNDRAGRTWEEVRDFCKELDI